MTDVSFDPNRSQVAELHNQDQGYWSRVWKLFNQRLVNRVALNTLIVFGLIYAGADLIANGSPLILSYGDQFYSPWLQRTDVFELNWALYPMAIAAVILVWAGLKLRRKRFLVVTAVGLFLTGAPNITWSPLPADLMAVQDWRQFTMTEMEKGDWALFAPIPYSLDETHLPSRLKAPDTWRWGGHLLGTDALGRDLAARLIHGTRISLLVGFVSVSIYVLIGLFLGGLAGFYGGWIDLILSRVIEVVICFPSFFLIITVLAMIEPSIWNIMIVIGLTRWTGVARLFRAEVLKVKTMEYIAAARAMGNRDKNILLRHILPNAIAPVLVAATFGVAGAILVESGLSFLGFGVQPPTPSWGEALSLARTYPYLWWIVTFPGVMIFLTVTAYNLVGEGLRDATDPRQV